MPSAGGRHKIAAINPYGRPNMNVSGRRLCLTAAVALMSIVALFSLLLAAAADSAAPSADSSSSPLPMAGHANPVSGMHGGSGMQNAGGLDMMQHHQQMMAGMHSTIGGVPVLPGQDAFGAIGEIVAILDADPATDWSKVNLEALRRHLIDMNEVTLNAEAAANTIDGGVEIRVTGTGRTLGAIQRMVPMHVAEIDGRNGWRARASPLPDGVLLTVTSSSPKEVQRLRALGFAGIMVSGAHHQVHHLAIARGEPMHGH